MIGIALPGSPASGLGQRGLDMFQRRLFAIVAILLATTLCTPSQGQVQQTPPPQVFGIYVDSDATLRYREKDAQQQLTQIRAQARAGAAKNEALQFVSLTRILSEARALSQAAKPLPADLRFPRALT